MKKNFLKALIIFNITLLLVGLLLFYKSFNLIAFYIQLSPEIKQSMMNEHGKDIEYNADISRFGVDIITRDSNGEELQRIHVRNYDNLIMFLSIIVNSILLFLYKREKKE